MNLKQTFLAAAATALLSPFAKATSLESMTIVLNKSISGLHLVAVLPITYQVFRKYQWSDATNPAVLKDPQLYKDLSSKKFWEGTPLYVTGGEAVFAPQTFNRPGLQMAITRKSTQTIFGFKDLTHPDEVTKASPACGKAITETITAAEGWISQHPETQKIILVFVAEDAKGGVEYLTSKTLRMNSQTCLPYESTNFIHQE